MEKGVIRTGYIEDGFDSRDLVFGSEQSLGARYTRREKLQPDGDWTDYLVKKEHQSPVGETNSCVAHATLSALEIYNKRKEGAEVNFSDRFLAVTSDTDPARGNTPRKVADALRHKWTVWENEWSHDIANVDEFYSPIPSSLMNLAEKRKSSFDFGYEKVPEKNVGEALQYSTLGIAVPAWFEDSDGRYYRPDGMFDTHWTVCFGLHDNGDYKVFDTYPPYIKRVRADIHPSVIYSYYIDGAVKPTFWLFAILRRLWM